MTKNQQSEVNKVIDKLVLEYLAVRQSYMPNEYLQLHALSYEEYVRDVSEGCINKHIDRSNANNNINKLLDERIEDFQYEIYHSNIDKANPYKYIEEECIKYITKNIKSIFYFEPEDEDTIVSYVYSSIAANNKGEKYSVSDYAREIQLEKANAFDGLELDVILSMRRSYRDYVSEGWDAQGKPIADSNAYMKATAISSRNEFFEMYLEHLRGMTLFNNKYVSEHQK